MSSMSLNIIFLISILQTAASQQLSFGRSLGISLSNIGSYYTLNDDQYEYLIYSKYDEKEVRISKYDNDLKVVKSSNFKSKDLNSDYSNKNLDLTYVDYDFDDSSIIIIGRIKTVIGTGIVNLYYLYKVSINPIDLSIKSKGIFFNLSIGMIENKQIAYDKKTKNIYIFNTDIKKEINIDNNIIDNISFPYINNIVLPTTTGSYIVKYIKDTLFIIPIYSDSKLKINDNIVDNFYIDSDVSSININFIGYNSIKDYIIIGGDYEKDHKNKPFLVGIQIASMIWSNNFSQFQSNISNNDSRTVNDFVIDYINSYIYVIIKDDNKSYIVQLNFYGNSIWTSLGISNKKFKFINFNQNENSLYITFDDSIEKYLACDSNCFQCSVIDYNQCQICIGGYYLIYSPPISQVILPTSAGGSGDLSDNNVQSSASSQGSSPSTPFISQPTYSKCYSNTTPPTNYKLDLSTMTFKPCTQLCNSVVKYFNQISNQYDCNCECPDGQVNEDNLCKPSCENPGTFLSNGECKPCPSLLKEYNHTCKPDCPFGTVETILSNNVLSCSKCKEKEVIFEGKCIQLSSLTRVELVKYCSEMNMLVRNEECVDRRDCYFFVFNSQCVMTCPEGYVYDKDNVCMQCDKKMYMNLCIDSCSEIENIVDIGNKVCVDRLQCNNGYSIIQDTSQKCICNEGYKGSNCEIQVKLNTSSNITQIINPYWDLNEISSFIKSNIPNVNQSINFKNNTFKMKLITPIDSTQSEKQEKSILNAKKERLSILSLSNCVERLRNKGYLSEKDFLEIVSFSYRQGQDSRLVHSNIVYSSNGRIINKTDCGEVKILLPADEIPEKDKELLVVLSKEGVFSNESLFFNDICYVYSDNKTDMTISERREKYRRQVICEEGCEYKGYDKDDYIVCICKELPSKSGFLIEEAVFSKVVNSNFWLFFCYNNIVVSRLFFDKGFVFYLNLSLVSALFTVVCWVCYGNRYYMYYYPQVIYFDKENCVELDEFDCCLHGSNQERQGKSVGKGKENDGIDLNEDEKNSKSQVNVLNNLSNPESKKIKHQNYMIKPNIDLKISKILVKSNINQEEKSNKTHKDSLSFRIYFLREVIHSHSILSLFFNKSILNPLIIRIPMLMLSISVEAFLMALFFSDDIIRKINSSKRNHFVKSTDVVYLIAIQGFNLIWPVFITKVLFFGISLLLRLSKKQRRELEIYLNGGIFNVSTYR